MYFVCLYLGCWFPDWILTPNEFVATRWRPGVNVVDSSLEKRYLEVIKNSSTWSRLSIIVYTSNSIFSYLKRGAQSMGACGTSRPLALPYNTRICVAPSCIASMVGIIPSCSTFSTFDCSVCRRRRSLHSTWYQPLRCGHRKWSIVAKVSTSDSFAAVSLPLLDFSGFQLMQKYYQSL